MDSSSTEALARFDTGLRRLLSGPLEWVLLTASRRLLAALLVGVFTLGVVAVAAVDGFDVRGSTDLLYLFQVLVGANVTLVTIVLSVNQLVLSREFKTPGELRDEIGDTIEYRNDVAGTTDDARIPTTPRDFLDALLRETQDHARQLEASLGDASPGDPADDVDDLISDLSDQTDRVLDTLEGSGEGVFETLAAAIDADFAGELSDIHRIQTVYDDDLDPATADELEELEENLKQIDVARQYFRAIYLQVELAGFSKLLLYVGVPAVGSGLLMLLVYAGAGTTPVRMPHLDVLVPVVVVLGFSPLAALFAYVLRIATVARRTVAITPFTIPDRESGR